MTNVLLAPTRSAADLAKQATSVDQLPGGRLSLGVGWRATDYQATGRSFDDRGRRFDQQLRDLKTAWAGEPIEASTKPVAPTPAQQGGVPLLIGGMTEAAVRRVVEFGAGWTAGGAPPDAIGAMIGKVRAAWRAAGREGEPRIAALAYFSLGEVTARSRAYLLDYYEPMGKMAEVIADSALRSSEAIRGAVETFTEIGVDELLLDPTVSDPTRWTCSPMSFGDARPGSVNTAGSAC